MTMAVIGFGYALYQSTQVKLVPYVFEVDKIGNGRQCRLSAADRICRSTGGASHTWQLRIELPIRDARCGLQNNISTGPTGYCSAPDPATEKVNAWFRSNSPFEKAKNSTVAIEVNNIVALSNQSYQIDWTEFERDRRGKENGRPALPRDCHGNADTAAGRGRHPPEPHRLYLRDFDWTAQL